MINWICENPGLALIGFGCIIVVWVWAEWGDQYCNNLLEDDKLFKETDRMLKNARRKR